MKTGLTAAARWRALACSEAPASYRASAACYGFSKDIGIVAIVVAELKFSQVEWQIFLAYVVISADDSAFKQRPERINILSVDLATHVLASYVADCLMRMGGRQKPIAAVFIGGNERHPFRHRSTDETVQRSRISIFDRLTNDVPLARDRANDGNLASRTAAFEPVFEMAIFTLAADVGFVHFHDSHQLRELRIAHRSAQPVAHVPSGAQRRSFIEIHPPNLKRRDAFFALKNRPKNIEPDIERIFCVLENRPCGEREAISVALAAFFIRAPLVPCLGDVVDELALQN
jgi:hypothetical protein